MIRALALLWLCVLCEDVFAMVRIPGGKLVREGAGGTKKREITVPPFDLDASVVTNGEFLTFVKKSPAWRRSKAPALLAEGGYLSHWKGDLSLSSRAEASRPVVDVSWFAAEAYCQSVGKRLPTNDEWDFVAEDLGRSPGAVEKMLAWYAQPATVIIRPAARMEKNHFGIAGLYDGVWEWTGDFNAILSDGSGREAQLFCGGAGGVPNPLQYALYVRQSFRASLQGRYVASSLGFRCARDVDASGGKP